ncbi:MAG: hypothetical protein IKT66_00580, partial [Alistipes sp.]|nr:hypothetical protein [Alistipes sp.]
GSVDRYYKTTAEGKNFGLYALSIIENDETKWNAMDESRDAFTTSQLIENFSSASTITLNLERPFAKLRVVATDIEAIKAVGLKPKAATVQYDSNTKLYRKYDVVTKTVSDPQTKGDTIIYDWEKPYYTDAQGEFTAFADYFFVAEGGELLSSICRFSVTRLRPSSSRAIASIPTLPLLQTSSPPLRATFSPLAARLKSRLPKRLARHLSTMWQQIIPRNW